MYAASTATPSVTANSFKDVSRMPFHIMMLLLVGAVVLLPDPVRCLTDPRVPDVFFPFGSDQGDVVAAPGDDLYDMVSMSSQVRVCNSVYTQLWVCTNGVVSFNRAVAEYSAIAFPIPGLNMLAAYWADVNTLINNGRIYYRQTNDYALAMRASRAIKDAITGQNVWPFNANWLLIATWHNVTYYGGSTTTPIQSFQVILASDGVYSFAIVNYGNMTWTHGTNSDVPAQVGYNCMDGLNFYTVPWSRTENVAYIGSQTNVATKGRWIFRLDGTNGTNICSVPTISASLPSHSCPTLSGPTVINRLWFEFYCTINTTVTDSRARFNVTFYSDGVAIYTATATATDRRVTLHERYLQGRLGKVLYCSAVSYWSDSPTQRSPEVRSVNFYTPGIEAIVYPMGVTESDSVPVTVVIKSTLPITCQQLDVNGQPTNCIMNFTIHVSSGDIAVRQRYPGSTSKACTFTLAESDWKPTENRAYNRDAPLELRAKIDLYVTAPRPSQIGLVSPLLSTKNVNGSSYANPWSDYTASLGQVFKYDSPSPLGRCSSVTDPHLTTFDGVGYTTLTIGQYIYARSTSSLAFEVQVRHWQCPLYWQGASCVCGVAIREESAILAADMCNDGIMHYITYDAKNLPNGAGITTSDNGNSFKILMPSGSKVIGTIYDFGLNIDLYVPEKIRTNGLCGSFDRNAANDLTYRDGNRVATVQSYGIAPVDFVESWSVFPNASLFEGHLSAIPGADQGTYTPSTFCSCELDKDRVCGGFAVTDNSSWKWEPNFVVKPKEPLGNANIGQTIRTDDTDYTYTPTFNQSSTVQNTGRWPTPSGINESQALSICKGRIVNATVIGSSCFSSLASANATSQLVQTCVADIRLTDDVKMSADSKVSQIQQSCIIDLVSRNRSDITNTSDIITQVLSVLPTVTAYRCDPFDCSGHGTCVNGRCNCTGDYVGSDCAVSRSAVPYISRLLDPSVCNIRTRLCQSVVMVTGNRTSNVSCKVVVTKLDGSNTTYFTSAQVRSPQTTACSLPLEPLDLYNVNFTALNASDFYRLKYGGAVLSYTVSISNNGRNYSAGQPMKVVDSMCMDCSGNNCTLKPNTTCRINGYCFTKFDRNPYDASWLCLPETSTDRWSTGQTVTFNRCRI